MNDTLVILGVICVIAAVVGGGLSALGVQLPPILSVRRQVVLGLVGIGLVILGKWGSQPFPVPAPTPTQTDSSINLTENATATETPAEKPEPANEDAASPSQGANPVSGAEIDIVPQPEAVIGREVAGYDSKFASVDYLITVQGEDVKFVSLDTEFRHMDGSPISPKTYKGRILNGGFRVEAGQSYRYSDNIPTDEPCSKAKSSDNGSINMEYTFNAVDMHGIPVAAQAIVRIVC